MEQFTLEILHNMILSLRLCNNDDSSIGTIENITLVIKNLTNIITSKSNLFLNSNNKRREYSNLIDFINWLFLVFFMKK